MEYAKYKQMLDSKGITVKDIYSELKISESQFYKKYGAYIPVDDEELLLNTMNRVSALKGD